MREAELNQSGMDKFEKLLFQIEKNFGRVKWEDTVIAVDYSSLEKYADYFRYGDGLKEVELNGIDKDKNKYLVKWVFDSKKFKWRVKEVKRLNENS